MSSDVIPPTKTELAKYVAIRTLLDNIVNSTYYTPVQIKKALDAQTSQHICIYMNYHSMKYAYDQLHPYYNRHLMNPDKVISAGPCIGAFIATASPMMVYHTPEALAKVKQIFKDTAFGKPLEELLQSAGGVLWCFEVIYNESGDFNRYFVKKTFGSATQESKQSFSKILHPFIESTRPVSQEVLDQVRKYFEKSNTIDPLQVVQTQSVTVTDTSSESIAKATAELIEQGKAYADQGLVPIILAFEDDLAR